MHAVSHIVFSVDAASHIALLTTPPHSTHPPTPSSSPRTSLALTLQPCLPPVLPQRMLDTGTELDVLHVLQCINAAPILHCGSRAEGKHGEVEPDRQVACASSLQASGFRVQGLGLPACRVQGFGFRV